MFVQTSLEDAHAFATEFRDDEVRRFFDAAGRLADPAGLKAHEDACYARFVEKYGLPVGDGKTNVAWILSDTTGCGYVRGFVPASALQRRSTRYNALVSATVCTEIVRWADVLVWQRTLSPDPVVAFRVAKQLGKLQVYETDDNLHEIPESNPAHAACRPGSVEYRTGLSWIKSCDEVIVSTPPLKAYYDRRLGVACTVIPNTIEIGRADEWPPAPQQERVRILWAGSSSHFDDLALVRGALRRIRDEYGKRVKIVLMGFDGRILLPDEGRVRNVGIRSDKVLPWRGSVEDYHRRLHATGFHVGLCPLADTTFNRSKSNLKWMEYSVAGIATIASDVGPYRASIEHDRHGLLVPNTEEAWVAGIRTLVDDAALRARLVAAARERIRERFDAARVHEVYEQVFDAALARHRARRADPR